MDVDGSMFFYKQMQINVLGTMMDQTLINSPHDQGGGRYTDFLLFPSFLPLTFRRTRLIGKRHILDTKLIESTAKTVESKVN